MSDLEYSDEEFDYEDDEEMLDADADDSASEMDIEAFDSFQPAAKGKEKSYDVPHRSLSQMEVEKTMAEDVEHISGIFGVDTDIAAILLRHMDWNKEKLIEKYMDNADAILVAAGISSEAPKSPDSSRQASARRTTRSATASGAAGSTSTHKSPKPPAVAEPFVCPICFDDSATETLALACEHAFCTGCWAAYVHSKVRGEGEHSIRCMAEGCSLVAPDVFVKRALSDDSATFDRFRELLVRHFVACKKELKFCPYPSCTYTVACPAAASKSSLATIVPTVTCGGSSAHRFCFGCDVEGDHRPCICAVARMWLKKCADDSETANWIKSNTKECSKCQSTIEKNGGCNHMTCKKCKWEFCWVCMGPWSEHGSSWYSCNRFDEKAGIDARDAQAKSRASLERYLHYYNRWANHEQSAKLSLELYAKTEQKMEAMQVTSSLTWIEVQFMRKAVDELVRCRTTLKWTYSMAYYLALDNAKELFEDNQRDLEKAVEDLSELLESPIEPENIPSLRQKVTDKTVYVAKRNEIMLEDTANGFADGRWSWNMTVEGFSAFD